MWHSPFLACGGAHKALVSSHTGQLLRTLIRALYHLSQCVSAALRAFCCISFHFEGNHWGQLIALHLEGNL